MTDKELLQNLLKQFADFKIETAKIIIDLQKEVVILKERLSKYENPKNSNNSSIPPSQDAYRQTKNLQKKSDKKVGEQKGHKGSKLLKIDTLDKIILHDITACECCKSKLPAKGEIKSRQIFDIPKIRIQVTGHRIISKICTNCGKKNKTNFPTNPIKEIKNT